MKRREFMAMIGGATAWPLAARAQQAQRMPRVGVLMNRAASDSEGQARVTAFKEGMQQRGWSEGRNVEIDTRFGADDIDLEQKGAAELIALTPDVIFASGTLSVAALRRVHRTVPIVFANVTDPLGAGFVEALTGPAAIPRVL
jgi:putative ABC transport system substrate-binding protein